MKYTLTAVYLRGSDGWIVACVEELGGAFAQGRTMKAAERNLRDAAIVILAEQIRENRDLFRHMQRIRRREIEVEMPRRFGRRHGTR